MEPQHRRLVPYRTFFFTGGSADRSLPCVMNDRKALAHRLPRVHSVQDFRPA